MSAKTVYRIRRRDTGLFYRGGSMGGWGERGQTYETAGACKAVWGAHKRRCGRYVAIPEADIIGFTVTEDPTAATPLP